MSPCLLTTVSYRETSAFEKEIKFLYRFPFFFLFLFLPLPTLLFYGYIMFRKLGPLYPGTSDLT